MTAPFWGLGWSVWLIPVVIVMPGLGFARALNTDGQTSRLRWLLDAFWIGAAITWLDVAIVRESGIPEDAHASALLLLAGAWTAAGWLLRRDRAIPQGSLNIERVGGIAVMAAVAWVAIWRAGDIARPLDSYWYLDGADKWRHEALPIQVVDPLELELHGHEDSGALSVTPRDGTVTLRAEAATEGHLVLAVQGDLGAEVRAAGAQGRVEASMPGFPGEGLIRRYLERGVAAIEVPVQLEEGETLEVAATGDRLYIMTTADAIWMLHAEGTLRFVHHYQILNQVENQVWAQEMLRDRWATLNQPPGWSPLLSAATVVTQAELPAAGALFLLVLVVVGLSAVRLCAVLVPRAPTLAVMVPAMMVAAHGLLMLEPGSQNFPDSLYAAAIIAVASAIAEGRLGWIAAMGIAAGLLRWPGVVVSSIFLMTWWQASGKAPWTALRHLWSWVVVGSVLAAIGVFTGVLEDLLFILYFETFPEHWHGEYSVTKLLPRVPGFYALWGAYTGGGLIWAIVGCASPRPSPARTATRWLLGAIGIYSLMLATIDHHPTHYFLPLIAVTGVAVVSAAEAWRGHKLEAVIPAAVTIGVLLLLWRGDTGLQPIEDMVVSIDALLN